MSDRIKSKKGLLKVYAKCSREGRDYLSHLPRLLDEFPMEVALAYSFYRLELGQNMALYGGVVKVHKANAELARTAISTQHMTRGLFVELYETVFGFALPAAASVALKTAEDTRDDVMHGKTVSQDRLRNAIARVLEYAEAMNKQLESKHNFMPFGNMKGFSGRAKKLDKATTRFMLKGIGFTLS